jgi:hypothetical protein
MKARLFYALLARMTEQRCLRATFTTNALITEADTSFDGQDIVVSGATLTVDGRHYFNSLLLTNGAALTHSPCTATNTHKLDLVVANEVMVSSNSRIALLTEEFASPRTDRAFSSDANDRDGCYGGLPVCSCNGNAPPSDRFGRFPTC